MTVQASFAPEPLPFKTLRPRSIFHDEDRTNAGYRATNRPASILPISSIMNPHLSPVLVTEERTRPARSLRESQGGKIGRFAIPRPKLLGKTEVRTKTARDPLSRDATREFSQGCVSGQVLYRLSDQSSDTTSRGRYRKLLQERESRGRAFSTTSSSWPH